MHKDSLFRNDHKIPWCVHTDLCHLKSSMENFKICIYMYIYKMKISSETLFSDIVFC